MDQLKPLEPLLPGETRSEYLDRLERAEHKYQPTECERLRALLEDARIYAAVCPVPDALTGPARFEMLERRARLGQRDGNPARRCAHGKLFTESCDGCGVVHPNDTEKQSRARRSPPQTEGATNAHHRRSPREVAQEGRG